MSVQEGLRGFLGRLEHADLLQRVQREVDPCFELSAVSERLEPIGKAEVFEAVKGYGMPVVTSVFGSRAQLALAFETTP